MNTYQIHQSSPLGESCAIWCLLYIQEYWFCNKNFERCTNITVSGQCYASLHISSHWNWNVILKIVLLLVAMAVVKMWSGGASDDLHQNSDISIWVMAVTSVEAGMTLDTIQYIRLYPWVIHTVCMWFVVCRDQIHVYFTHIFQGT